MSASLAGWKHCDTAGLEILCYARSPFTGGGRLEEVCARLHRVGRYFFALGMRFLPEESILARKTLICRHGSSKDTSGWIQPVTFVARTRSRQTSSFGYRLRGVDQSTHTISRRMRHAHHDHF